MLLHLDSYDLINVFRQSSGPDELRRQLIETDTKLVCSAETIQELVKPNNVQESQRRLETLTTFPRLYIHAKKELFRREFSCAIRAFQNDAGCELNLALNPFAGTWQEIDPPLDKHFGVAKDCLVEIIMPLLKSEPDRFRNTAADLQVLMANVEYDRDHQLNLRMPAREIFTHSVGATLLLLGLHPAPPCEQFIEEFAEWLRKKPSVCPAWRLMGETYSELAQNSTDQGQTGDTPDFAHVTVTPYVDSITLDGRVSNYVRIATRRLVQMDSKIDYEKRVFRNLSDWLASSKSQICKSA